MPTFVPDVNARQAKATLVRFDAGEFSITGSAKSVYAGKLGKYADVDIPASASLAGPWAAVGNFSGKVFGLAYQLISGSAPPGVMIDGIAYDVPIIPLINPFGRNVTSIPQRVPGVILARDLDESKLHYVEITFPQHLTEARRWRWFGMLLDQDAGYVPEARHCYIPSDVTALTTSWAGITRSTTATDANNYGGALRRVYFFNTTAADIRVSLSRTSADANTFWSKNCPANDCCEFDPGDNLMQNGYLFAKSGAAGVNCYVMEAF